MCRSFNFFLGLTFVKIAFDKANIHQFSGLFLAISAKSSRNSNFKGFFNTLSIILKL